jgi:sulfur transfer complex TusBCD TusB component (DsrH family)
MGGDVEPRQHPVGVAAVESVVRPRAWRGHLVVTLWWAGVLAVSTRVELGHAALTVAVAVHVMGLVLGLGAVVLVDWYGLAWMAGLRSLRECLRLAQAAHPLIWFGLGLLLVSGIGLAADLGSMVAWLKQGLVLVLLNNGVALRAQSRRLKSVSTATSLRALPPAVRAQLIASVAVSQVSWWGAVVIGFITAGIRSAS